MRVPSSRTFVIAGFAISLISVALNSIILSKIDTRLKAADSEHGKLVESLNSQKAALDHSDLQLGFYTLMRDQADLISADKAENTRADAGYFLGGAITDMYVAANAIPQIEVLRVESEELNAAFPKIDKMIKIAQRLKRAAAFKE